jgi:hypothetical protein
MMSASAHVGDNRDATANRPLLVVRRMGEATVRSAYWPEPPGRTLSFWWAIARCPPAVSVSIP